MAGEEKKLENKIKKYVSMRGGYIVKYHGGTYGRSGVPDLLICYKGRFIALEVKKPTGGITSVLQDYNVDSIRLAGGIADVVTSLDKVIDILGGVDND